MPPAINTEGIVFLGCLDVRVWLYTKSSWTLYRANCVWQFQQAYNSSTDRNKGELIGFSGEKVKDRGHDDTTKALWEFCIRSHQSCQHVLVWLGSCMGIPCHSVFGLRRHWLPSVCIKRLIYSLRHFLADTQTPP